MLGRLGHQLLELFFFDVVVAGCYRDDDANGDVNGKTLDGPHESVLDESDDEGNCGCHQKDLEDAVFEVLEDEFAESSNLRRSLEVLTVPRLDFYNINYFFSRALISLVSPSIPVYRMRESK